MQLSDIMSNAGLSVYAQIALVIFLAAFVAIAVRTFAPSRRRELDEASKLPLDDGHVIAHGARHERQERQERQERHHG